MISTKNGRIKKNSQIKYKSTKIKTGKNNHILSV